MVSYRQLKFHLKIVCVWVKMGKFAEMDREEKYLYVTYLSQCKQQLRWLCGIKRIARYKTISAKASLSEVEKKEYIYTYTAWKEGVYLYLYQTFKAV